MRPSTRKWLLVLSSLVMLFIGTTRIDSLNAQRQEHHLVLPPLPDEMAPSMLYTPLLALGRAPLVDVLWLRATKLKEQGRFFDALQLSQRICELQPKFASVWVFQAWNMSYNISVTLKAHEDRWRWVNNGFRLLRDKGIPLNPNNTQLYRELGWILFHKVGDFLDDSHYYYKLQFALEMESILGEPPDDFVQPGRVRGDYYREYDYQSLADAPLRFEELLTQPEVKTLVNGLHGFSFDASEPGIYLSLLSSIRRDDVKIPGTPDHEQVNRKQELLALMRDPGGAVARNALENFWRAYRLRNEVKLDPKRIVELHSIFGVNFDYRLAETHALYWASMGVEKGTDKRAAMDIHKLNTNRLVFFCLQKMFHRGRVAMSPNAYLGEPPLLSPDLRVVPVLFQAFIDGSETYLKNEKTKKPISTNFQTGFVGFLRSAILRYHEVGRDEEGKKYFDYLREHFSDPMYERGMAGFLREQMKPDRELNDLRVAMARIRSLIGRGLQRYAYNEDEDAVRYLARSKQVFESYQKNIVSKRMQIRGTWREIVEDVAHSGGTMMYPGSYQLICEKLGIEPRTNTLSPANESS